MSQATEAVKFPGAHAGPARWGALRRPDPQRCCQQRGPDPEISGRKGVISSLILSFIHTEQRPHTGALFCYFKHDFDEILHLFDFYGMLFLALSMSGKRLPPLLSGRRFFAPISFWKGGLTMVYPQWTRADTVFRGGNRAQLRFPHWRATARLLRQLPRTRFPLPKNSEGLSIVQKSGLARKRTTVGWPGICRQVCRGPFLWAEAGAHLGR